jgi:molybdopterin-biosynthesis enzyme MoeA-like protein
MASKVDAPPPRAAALVIGAEILNGSVVDTNTPWLAKLLYRCRLTPS